MGMFDTLLGGKAVPQTATSRAPEGVQLAAATPEQIRAAVERLKAKGIKPTKANVAEEIAVGDMSAPAAPPPAPLPTRPVLGGPQPSPEMLQSIKAAQDARNRAVLERALEERRRMSGAR